jgi:hypothetical protein
MHALVPMQQLTCWVVRETALRRMIKASVLGNSSHDNYDDDSNGQVEVGDSDHTRDENIGASNQEVPSSAIETSRA